MNINTIFAILVIICFLVFGILVTSLGITNKLNIIIDDRIMRVTEVKHIANIEHFYGNLPTGEIINETANIKK